MTNGIRGYLVPEQERHAKGLVLEEDYEKIKQINLERNIK